MFIMKVSFHVIGFSGGTSSFRASWLIWKLLELTFLLSSGIVHVQESLERLWSHITSTGVLIKDEAVKNGGACETEDGQEHRSNHVGD